MSESPPRIRKLRLRYAATCSVCGLALSAGTEALWDREEKKATCLACGGASDPAALHGVAGGGALKKGAEIEERRIREAREKWGDHAAAVAEQLAKDDRSVKAWVKGGDGESRLAAFVEREVGDAVIALHDRVIPGTRGQNIDHLFVASTGVWVVDAKAYKGKLEKRDAGPLWRADYRVYVGGRDRSKVVKSMAIQLKAVRAALELDPNAGRIAIHPAVCFVESDWDLLARPFQVEGVTILYPGALRSRLKKKGGLSREAMERIAHRLALALPSAA